MRRFFSHPLHLGSDVRMDHGPKKRSRQPKPPMTTWALLFYNVMMTVGILLAAPLWLPMAITSSKRRQTIRQRLGIWRYPWEADRRSTTEPPLWVHALSVGEVSAAQPLIDGIRQRYPQLPIVLSTSTWTGYQTASQLFEDQPIALAYFPYDWFGSVRLVAKKINPRAVVLVETDIWPNVLSEMHRRQIPVYMVNFRISDSALRWYRRFKWVAAHLFGAFDRICLQTQRDAGRLLGLGIDEDRLCVTGNIKFDRFALDDGRPAGAHWRKALGLGTYPPVLVAGSTHDGEEIRLLNAVKRLTDQGRALRMIIAPRDHNRAGKVVALSNECGLSAMRLSDCRHGGEQFVPAVIVVDTMGVLKELFSVATMAFVGGSLVNEGGHNPLEPAACGIPVLFGPDMRDFHQIAAWLVQSGGARQVGDTHALVDALSLLMDNESMVTDMGKQAKTTVASHQGAVAQTLSYLNLSL